MGRKEKKYHFIYKTTNILSGRYYIGMHSTDNLDDGYLGSGRRLKYSLNKYGKENHIREIIEYCDSRNELKNREAEVVNLNEIAKEGCMNLKVGGEGGFSSEEHMIKCSKAGNEVFVKRYNNDNELRIKMVKKSLINITNYNKIGDRTHKSFEGKKHSEESKLKISKSMKDKGIGKSNSQYDTMWITNDIENRKIKKNGMVPNGWRKGRVIKKINLVD